MAAPPFEQLHLREGEMQSNQPLVLPSELSDLNGTDFDAMNRFQKRVVL